MFDALFLGVPDVDGLVFFGLSMTAFFGTFIGVTTDAAGGVVFQILLTVLALRLLWVAARESGLF